MSESLRYAQSYAWPCNCFGCGIFFRVVWLLRVDGARPRHEKRRWNHEIVFASDDILIEGMIIMVDTPVKEGEARFYDFDPDDESIPHGINYIPSIHLCDMLRDFA